MQLSSSAFSEGTVVPRRFTCDGEGISPPLEWSGAPAETRSFALVCDDPDAPGGTWHHWVAYDMPVSLTALPTGASKEARQLGFKQTINDFRRVGYGGPCPPRGHGPHRYRFQLLALAINALPARTNPSGRDVEHEARRHVITEAILTGTYER